MSDHKATFVPLETWSYHSPRLARDGIHADVGGLAEALIYYDRVLVNVQHHRELEALVARFARDGLVDYLIRLLSEGTLVPYHFAFHSTTISHPDGEHEIFNIQGADQALPQWFSRGVLPKASLDVLPKAQQHDLVSLLEDKAIEVKAADYVGVIETAWADVFDPDRSTLLVQALVDDVHDLLGMSNPPKVATVVRQAGDQAVVTWNVDLDRIGQVINQPMGGRTPVQASIMATRYLWAAASQGVDLVLGSPLSRIAGDKLYEAASRASDPQEIVHQLVEEVEFPDVRRLVNTEALPLSMAITLREKAGRFRTWLQAEAERDRDAIVAYHHEVAKEAGFTKAARHTLSILSTPGGSIAGGIVGGTIGDPLTGAAIGGITAAAAKRLLDRISLAGKDWKPTMFGNWASASIRKYLADHPERASSQLARPRRRRREK